jgi:hypothetical protein
LCAALAKKSFNQLVPNQIFQIHNTSSSDRNKVLNAHSILSTLHFVTSSPLAPRGKSPSNELSSERTHTETASDTSRVSHQPHIPFPRPTPSVVAPHLTANLNLTIFAIRQAHLIKPCNSHMSLMHILTKLIHLAQPISNAGPTTHCIQ